MNEKIAVQLDKFITTRYAYQKIHYCTSCGRYTVLTKEGCPGCGKGQSLISMDRYFDLNLRRRFQIEIMIVLTLLFLGLPFARNLFQILILFAAGTGSCIVLILLQRVYRKSERTALTDSFFNRYYDRISIGVKLDANGAAKKTESGDFKGAYQDLREVGVIIKNDLISKYKLICLSRFVLRRDADLELDTLVLSDYNLMLMRYINDVLKLNRDMIKKNVIDYVIKYEENICREEWGEQLLGCVADAMIRTMHNVTEYKDFITRHLKNMSKDRVLRLYTLVNGDNSCNLNGLYGELLRVISTKYKDDPDFNEKPA